MIKILLKVTFVAGGLYGCNRRLLADGGGVAATEGLRKNVQGHARK